MTNKIENNIAKYFHPNIRTKWRVLSSEVVSKYAENSKLWLLPGVNITSTAKVS